MLRFAREQVMYQPDWVRGALSAVARRRLTTLDGAIEAERAEFKQANSHS